MSSMPKTERVSKPPLRRPRHDWNDWRHEHRLTALANLRARYGRPGAIVDDVPAHAFFDDHTN
jgi:hypothetical protein